MHVTYYHREASIYLFKGKGNGRGCGGRNESANMIGSNKKFSFELI